MELRLPVRLLYPIPYAPRSPYEHKMGETEFKGDCQEQPENAHHNQRCSPSRMKPRYEKIGDGKNQD